MLLISPARDPSLRLKKTAAVGMTQSRKYMSKNRRFFVYIMTNRPRSHVLYTGITGDLPRRVFQHKNKLVPGFTSRYNLTRLVYYEEFVYPDAAIDREKEIKGWRRSKKIALIESMNPCWNDLADKWADTYKPDSGGAPRKIPRPAGENADLRDDAA
jgi:putative endonuclease